MNEWNEWMNGMKRNEMKWSEMKWNEMNEWMNERMNEWNEWMNMNKWMNERTNEWMHEVFDIWNGGHATVSCICAYFAGAIFQKCSEQFIFFQHFQEDIGLLLESRAHFTDPIF